MEALSAKGVTKYFADTATLANDRIDFRLDEGEIRAVVGENGAGKSTFARILAGLVKPDAGEIRAAGRRLEGGSVLEAEEAGIGFVPQLSLLAKRLSVAENIVLGREPGELGFLVSKRKAYVESAMLFERFGVRLDPEAVVESLSPAERRQTEIARALARGGKILILDEPTSILSGSEGERLFDLLARLAQAGKSVILITHRLSEVIKAADSVTVLRSGAVIAERRVEETGEAELSRLMARQAAGPRSRGSEKAVKPDPRNSAPALSLRGLRLARGARPVRIDVRSGEILAVTALAGNGLSRLEEFASGMSRPGEGEVLIGERRLESIPRDLLRSELLGYAPEEREARGLCLAASMRDNLLILRRKEFRFMDWLGRAARDRAARAAADRLGVRAPPEAAVASLSGGTRQRLLLARELDRPRPVIVLAEPFQGLDLAAQDEVAGLMRDLALRGSALLLLLSKAEEIIGLADRAIALYRGEIAYEGTVEGEGTKRALLAAMAGAPRGPAA